MHRSPIAKQARVSGQVHVPASHPLRALAAGVAMTVVLGSAAGVLAYSGDADGDLAANALETIAGTDAFDAGSKPEHSFFAVYGGPVCTDGLDNDGDGDIDGADAGCVNSDGDGMPTLAPFYPADDRIELYFQSIDLLPGSTPESSIVDQIVSGPPLFLSPAVLTCSDGVDNDLNGLADAADTSPSGCGAINEDYDVDYRPNSVDSEGPFPNHNGVQGHDDCADIEDNDGDGLTDMADPDCVFGGDNDGDGNANVFDSEGPQGANFAGVGGADDCFDGVDNDADGAIDLGQAECLLCSFQAATQIGTSGNDVLVGTSGPDVILGMAGDDRIRGLDGDDVICAGPGNDRLIGALGGDYLDGGEGDDRLSGGPGDDGLLGGLGADRLIGGPDDDQIVDDYPVGPLSDDLLSGGPGMDVAVAFGGTNLLRGGGDDDQLYVFDGVNRMLGGGGNDILQAESGTNTMRGGGGDDSITGGDGVDDLNGGGGLDGCDGGEGSSDTATPNCETISNVP